MDSTLNLDDLVEKWSQNLNERAMNFKVEDEISKMKKYYAAKGEYYQNNIPEFYPIFKERFEKYYKIW